jgi:hypothetical protein
MSLAADSVRTGISTFSPELVTIVSRWLQLCSMEHDVCQSIIHPEDSFIPPRLVDVGIEEHYSPRICLGASLPQGTKYVTLSHCWGGKVAVTLEKANLKDLMVQLPQSIPRTFADAIQVVRAIGLRYIWIDSLCIVQDSKTDWQRNAALMDRIYEFSWFNIAATGAINSQGGLFLERAPSSHRPVKVFLRLESMSTMEYFCWEPGMKDWYQNIDCSVLLSRGWVIQERILSPRILHFAKGQIFWECPRLRSSEVFPQGFPNNFTFKPSLDAVTLELESLRLQFRIRGRQAFEVWNHYVRMYSACVLTFPKKDKFLAISGLAKRTGSPYDYVAGLWKTAIILQLLWSVGDRCERQEEWRAPTWSWASVDGQIFHKDLYDPEFGHYSEIVASFVDASVKLATDNSYGPITDGTLVLDAPLIRSTVYGVDVLQPSNSQCVYLNYIQAHITLDVEYLVEASTVFVMPLHVNSRPDRGPVVSGIILKPATQPGVFYRCGRFDAEMSTETRWIERFIKLLSGEREPKEYGQSVGKLWDSGWKLYRITLK